MSLEPMASGDTPSAPADTTGNPVEGNSFRERKLAALQAESDPQPGTPEQISQRGDAESAEDLDPYHRPPEEQQYGDTPTDQLDEAGEEQDTPDEGNLFIDEDDEQDTPGEEPQAADEDAPDALSTLQQRYDNLEKKFREVTENRTAIESEMTATAERNVQLSHDLEDNLSQAKTRAKLFMDLANNHVSQFEQMDWSQIEPENMAAAKQQYQQAVINRDAMVKAFEETDKAEKQARELVRQREADHSRSILPIKIPGWSNELYGTLRDFAMKRYGYTAAEFNDITDFRPILMAHDSWIASQAVRTVEKVKRENKARRPRNRNARQQPRNAQGRYQSAKDKAHANPGDRGSFREMKQRQLEAERGSRR